ncbi:DDB1- and CUL4-associated factor 8-like [Drosophila eugracilis]|uniref:DDB1- and CUL4-associated factor 8-like n=1 Tax=Drosophila eugracilis TaxID=29029 RepID=UPI0007E7465B|nr:DDB1- and CUL4-associated factor 8-like [Drosophila eugracilis]
MLENQKGHSGLEDVSLCSEDENTFQASLENININGDSSNGDNDDTLAESFPDEADPAVNIATRERFYRMVYQSKPACIWNTDRELLHREHNITNRIEWRSGHNSEQSFIQRYYGSALVVTQLTLTKTLNSCRVAHMNFNRDGNLICSVTGGNNIVVWDWANNKKVHRFRPGHGNDILGAKFIESGGRLDIVSASEDGQVFRTIIPPSGGAITAMRLYNHSNILTYPKPKIVLVPHSQSEIMSAGRDGWVKLFDTRLNSGATAMLQCIGHDRRRIPLVTIAHHPLAPEFCVGGDDDRLRVFDKRKSTESVHEIVPGNFSNIADITDVRYNHSGSEVLACFRFAGVYLFDSRNYKAGEYLNWFKGRYYSANFFGPRSEFIITGDFDSIIFWEKKTEAIIGKQIKKAGRILCLEAHPWYPVLATAGENSPGIHFWFPNGFNLDDQNAN